MMFDEGTTKLLQDISQKGYINNSGKPVKGTAAIIHEIAPILKRPTSIVPKVAETTDIVLSPHNHNPLIKKVLPKVGVALVIGLAIKGAFDIVKDTLQKHKSEINDDDTEPEN